MKRTPLVRKTRLSSDPAKALRRTGKLKAVNVEAEKKRRQRYAKRLAAMKKGEGYAEAKARAGGRCEFTIRVNNPEALRPTYDPPDVDFGTYTPWAWDAPWTRRCVERNSKEAPLHAHHKTYARFGGNELPDDLLFCCKAHHDYLESKHPTRKRQRKYA